MTIVISINRMHFQIRIPIGGYVSNSLESAIEARNKTIFNGKILLLYISWDFLEILGF